MQSSTVHAIAAARSCHRTPNGIKRTVGRCMPIHSLCCIRTRMHVYTYITTLPRRVQRRCNAPRSTAPGWLISCRAFHVTVSLLSRLCHFTASTHAHACPAPQTRYHVDRDSARPPAQSKLHCNRGCNRRAINQCLEHSTRCVLPIFKSRPRRRPSRTKQQDRYAMYVDHIEMKASGDDASLPFAGFDSVSQYN